MAERARGRQGGSGGQSARAKRARGHTPAPAGPWATMTWALLLAALALRVGVLALEHVPVHFDEAQYWAYGQEFDWGYYSKPPLIAWVIRAATGFGGDTLFWLRLASPVAHGLIGWLIFLTGRRLWDGETGFWAAAGYTAAPGVALSSMIMSTDPVMMVPWAAALYALVRAEASEGPIGSRLWWGITGALVGVGMLAKYTMLAFVFGALASRLLPLRGRDWIALGIAAAAALAVMAPNILWNAEHGFATVAHVLADADAGKGYFHPLELAEFAGAQFGVIGPVFLIAILLAVRGIDRWIDDRGMRLMAWQTLPLIAAMAALALATRANANWAAPAYIGGSLMAARWLITAGGWPALRAQLWIGVAASALLWSAAGLYAGQADRLTVRLDPFRQMRIAEPFCELALGVMADEGAEVLLSDNRRRLSECMFQGGLGWDEVAVWNPDRLPHNHAEMVSGLQPGDDRAMLLMVHRGAARIAHHFGEAREVESGALATHIDREEPYEIWAVQGFKGY